VHSLLDTNSAAAQVRVSLWVSCRYLKR
jgi:hypothetical protein